ncbi:hypothetical protein [Pseudemcibacter aquimaris]|uniref:hypothetical protein n=1 Tax=Pseudemcibacter aquimaris TaxID=2857064 RepID=UPI0020127969|nr:hypothetical protein [Pseudemcibacter aquimaris]MCC3859876.1 hypothetical protein [Pseudemcibacter aquimaris]WDU57208.1 hypothetical protein KW060_08355 [Pseudemcibacter aquimaris]
MTNNIEKVKHISSRMEKFCFVLMLIIPAVLVWSWFNYDAARGLGLFQRIPHPLEAPTTMAMILGGILSVGLGAFVIGAVYHLKQFFKFSSDGDLFSSSGAESFHKATKYMVFYTVMSIPYESILGVIMTWSNPAGERELMITFMPYDLALIFTSLVLFAVSRVLKESVRVAEENAQIV